MRKINILISIFLVQMPLNIAVAGNQPSTQPAPFRPDSGSTVAPPNAPGYSARPSLPSGTVSITTPITMENYVRFWNGGNLPTSSPNAPLQGITANPIQSPLQSSSNTAATQSLSTAQIEQEIHKVHVEKLNFSLTENAKKHKQELEHALNRDSIARKEKLDAALSAQLNDYQASLDDNFAKFKASLNARIKRKTDEIYCFTGETPVALKADNEVGYRYVPISSIQIDDLVLTCNLKTGQTCEYGRVRNITSHPVTRLVKLMVNGKEILTTDNHPFYVAHREDTVMAIDLNSGDQFLSLSGYVVSLGEREVIDRNALVYNLSIEGNENYYVCDILVHNCNLIAAGTVAAGARNVLTGAEIGGAVGGPFVAVAGGVVAGIAGIAIGEVIHNVQNEAANNVNSEGESDKVVETSQHGRKEVMRDEGIPTSQQPISQTKNASGRQYQYEVPKEGGGTKIKSVQQQTKDRSHPGENHWEAGSVKTDQFTGEIQYNKYGAPKLRNPKSKVNYDK